jgi:hypothetical protein
MALAARISGGLAKPDALDVKLPSVRDDSAYAAAEALLTAFRERYERLGRDRLCLDYERHFAGRAPESDSGSDRDLRKRWVALRNEAKADAPPPVKPAAQSAAIAAGLAVLGGERIDPPADLQARYQEIDRKRAALTEAIREQTDERDGIADELSFKFSTELRPAWDRLQIEMYRAAQELARAAARVRTFRNHMIEAGIKPNSQTIRMPPVRAPLVLGSESEWGSELSQWGRQLEEWNLI